MKCEPTPIDDPTWDQLALMSPDAWFWHTSAWRTYAREYLGDRFLGDHSFTLREGARTIAICPLIIERGTPYDSSARTFGFGNSPTPAPAFDPSLSADDRSRAAEFYARELEQIAREHKVAYARVRTPAVAPAHLRPTRLVSNPLVRAGFTELPFTTQVLDLTLPEDQLWREIRKGHRSDVKDAEREVQIKIWDAQNVSSTIFQAYRELHRKDAGRQTRSAGTFDLMHEWVEGGTAALFEASQGGISAAFALIIRFGSGAFYGSSCKDPAKEGLRSQHLIQWKAIQWLRAQGCLDYDLGQQTFGAQWFETPDAKELGIAKFKRGFGGHLTPLWTAERHYDAEHQRLTWQGRMERLSSASRKEAVQ